MYSALRRQLSLLGIAVSVVIAPSLGSCGPLERYSGVKSGNAKRLQGLALAAHATCDTAPGFQCPSGSINVNDRGICPGLQDNGLLLKALRDELLETDSQGSHTLCFPPSSKVYRYTFNRWLRGLARVTVAGGSETYVDGTGRKIVAQTKLENIQDDPHMVGADRWPFFNGSIQQDYGDIKATKGADFRNYPFHIGYRFLRPAVAGDTQIVLREKKVVFQKGNPPVSFVEELQSGDRILIAGLSQMNYGHPLNARTFQFNRIEHITKVGSSYVVNLQSPLADDYPLLWDLTYTHGYNFGLARIFKLQRRHFQYPKQITIRNVEFLSNRGIPTSSSLQLIAEHVVLDGVIGKDANFNIFATESHRFEVRNSLIGGEIEIDKQVGEIIIDNNTILAKDSVHGIKAGSSCQRAVITNNRIYSRINAVCNGELIIENNTIDIRTPKRIGGKSAIIPSAVSFYNGYFGGISARVANNLYKFLSNQTPVQFNMIDLVSIEHRVDIKDQEGVTTQVVTPIPWDFKVKSGSTLEISTDVSNIMDLQNELIDKAVYYRLMALFRGTLVYATDDESTPIAEFVQFRYSQNKVILEFRLLYSSGRGSAQTAADIRNMLPLRGMQFQNISLSTGP